MAIFGCETVGPQAPVPENWRTVNARDKFTFEAPSNLASQLALGVDSFVGRYASPSMELTFDYGWFSDSLERFKTHPDYSAQTAIIGGKTAIVVTWKGHAAVYFPRVTDKIKLTMSAKVKDSAAVDDAQTIFRSVRFP